MRPDLYIFLGLIASGKSTLAYTWAEELSLPYFNSDVIRKDLAGYSSTTRKSDTFNQGIYTPEMSRKTYDALLQHAKEEIDKGGSVVLDASYSSREERDKVMRFSREKNVSSHFVLCQCSEEETRNRLLKRSQDPSAVSDADWSIYKKQVNTFSFPDELPPENLTVLETNAPIPELIKSLKENLSQL